MRRRTIGLALALLGFAVTARGEGYKPPRMTPLSPEDSSSELVPRRDIPPQLEEPEAPAPWLSWMLHPLKRGMWIRLPIVDTDPNRGITVGVMPIWVLKAPGSDRIKQIHAPSITYNRYFQVTPTYRYYYYPQEDAALVARASVGKYEHEILGHYEDQSFAGSSHDVVLRVQENIDAGQRFFGVGPNTPRSNETNFKEDTLTVKGTVGAPLAEGSNWRAHIGNTMVAEKVSNGPLPGLQGFSDVFPRFQAEHRHQTDEMRFTLDYDTRDHPVTTTQGSFVQFYRAQSVRDFASSYDYSRSGFDGRLFHPWKTERKQVTAVQLQFEQLMGDAPFWLLPRLGGKYSLRAYGDGRYMDRSMVALNVEQRYTVWDTRMGGVTTEFEVAPFVGAGTVADNPGSMALQYLRPVVGGAIRAVARPQVVGSVDFGVGREGLAVFMDINYSF